MLHVTQRAVSPGGSRRTGRNSAPALALAALAALLTAGPASAQFGSAPPTPRSFHIGVGGGVSVPAGDLDQALDNGVNAKAFVSWQPMGMPFGIRGSFNYEKFDLKPITPGLPTDGSGQILSGLANLTLAFPIGPFRPYVTAGLGAFQMDADAPSGAAEPDSKIHFGIDGGAGLEVRLGPLSAFVEGRLANVFTDQGLDPSLSTAEGFAAQTIPITFGLIY